MKYIKKYNESKEEIDKEYILLCFADLMDDGTVIHENKDRVNNDNIMLKIPGEKIPKLTYTNNINDVDLHIEDIKKHAEDMEDVVISIKRILDKYPNYEYIMEHDDGLYYGEKSDEEYIKIYFYL